MIDTEGGVMFQLLKVGVIDKVVVEGETTSADIVDKFMDTGWQSAIVEKDGKKSRETVRLLNKCCEKKKLAAYARSGDGRIIIERMA